MASVRISVSTGDANYDVDMTIPETVAEAFGPDKSQVDRMVDEAVARVKRAYWPAEEGAKK